MPWVTQKQIREWKAAAAKKRRAVKERERKDADKAIRWAKVVELREAGKTYPEIIRATGYSDSHVHRILERHGLTEHPIPKSDIAKAHARVCEMRRGGATHGEIARATGYSPQHVFRILERHGLIRRAPR